MIFCARTMIQMERYHNKQIIIDMSNNSNLTATLHNNLVDYRLFIDQKSSNAIESFYRMGANERRLIIYILAKSVPDHRTESFPKYISLEISEIKKNVFPEIRYNTGSIYERIKAAANNLTTTLIYFIDPITNEQTYCCWLSSHSYKEGTGIINVEISEKLKPVLIGFKERYTVFKIPIFGKIKGGYPIRIYEFLKSKASLGRYITTIDDLRKTIQIPPNKMPLVGDLNKKIIAPALSQLEEKTDIIATYRKANTGRKWTHIEFTIKPNKKNIQKAVKTKASVSNEPKSTYVEPTNFGPATTIEEFQETMKRYQSGVDVSQIVNKI